MQRYHMQISLAEKLSAYGSCVWMGYVALLILAGLDFVNFKNDEANVLHQCYSQSDYESKKLYKVDLWSHGV